MLKSKIKSKKPIKFGQVLSITKLYTPNIEEYKKGLQQSRGNISDTELQSELFELSKRDTYYNAVMDEVAKAYEFDLDESEVREKIDSLCSNQSDIPVDALRSRVGIMIKKQLIYDDLAEDWEISVDDSHVRATLEQFYTETGNPIREYIENPSKFEEVRAHLKEQIISDRLMNAFKPVYNLGGDL